MLFFFFSSRRRHTRLQGDWSSDVCSSDLVAVARARRVHFARRLVEETDLSMAEVAFSAGFHSIRAFNHALSTTFGFSPTELRSRDRRRGSLPEGEGLTVGLPYRPPPDWEGVLGFLAPRAIPGVEAVDGGYRRTVEVDGEPGFIAVRADPDTTQLW